MLPQYDVHPLKKEDFGIEFDQLYKFILYTPYRCEVCFFIRNFFPIPFGIKNYEKEKLFRCSGCKILRYCSREHQKIAWKHHKQLCKAIQLILKEHNIENLSEFYNRFQIQIPIFYKFLILAEKLLVKLRRKFGLKEILIICFEKACFFCKVSQMSDKTIMCGDCKVAFYCNEKCKSVNVSMHKEHCENFKIIFNFVNVLEHYALKYENSPKNINMIKDKSLIDFLKHFDKNLNPVVIPTKQNEFTLLNSISSFSGIVTILFCLQYCKLLDKFEHLVIHIFFLNPFIDDHDFNKNKVKLLLSQTCNVKKLTLVIIKKSQNYSFVPNKFLIKFSNKEISVEEYVVFGEYNDYLQTPKLPKLSKQPHFVFFNNLNDVEKEIPSHFFNQNYINTIFAFTTDNFELSKENLNALKSKTKIFNTIIENAKNPFRALIPSLDVDHISIPTCLNSYLNIFKITK